jgi:hypothetical protein
MTTEDYIARLIANGAALTLPADAVLESDPHTLAA